MTSFSSSKTKALNRKCQARDAVECPAPPKTLAPLKSPVLALMTSMHRSSGSRARVAAIPASGHRRPVCHAQQGFRRQRGQAMTEYLVIVALVAVAAIAVYGAFGQVIRAQVAGLARELSGESATQAVDAARSASNNALKQKRLNSLKSYGNQEQ